MQAADEGGGGAAGAGGGPSGPEGLAGPGGPNSVLEGQGGPVSPSGPGGPSDQVGPGGPDSPSGQGGPGGPRGPDSQGGPGGPSGRGGPGGPGSPGGEETVRSAAVGAPNVARAAQASGPGGDAAPVDAGSENRRMVFTLTVPFRSPLEAEMALRAVAPAARRPPQAVQKEFTVNGSVLAVWTADDPGLLQISVNSFLDQLSLVVRNIRRIGPTVPLSLGRGKGG